MQTAEASSTEGPFRGISSGKVLFQWVCLPELQHSSKDQLVCNAPLDHLSLRRALLLSAVTDCGAFGSSLQRRSEESGSELVGLVSSHSSIIADSFPQSDI